MSLTITIPIKAAPKEIEEAIARNQRILETYPIIVVDRQGGDVFKTMKNATYFKLDSSFWDARRFALEKVETTYVLCLDIDTVLPENYVKEAILS